MQYLQRIIPSGLTELVLYLGSKPDIVNNKKSITENLFLSGHQKEFYDLQITQDLSVFSVVFHPQGLMNFFNLPLHELYDQNVPLKYINKKLEQELFPRLQNTFSFQERVNLIEYHFTEMLKKNQISSEFQRISKIANLIKEHHGKVTIDSLASQACLSRKQFERKFAEFIGTTPKQYLKTIRLQLALYLKSQNEKFNTTAIAHESGYYDQSHFINEFKCMTGITPKQYFRNNQSFSDFFS